MTTLSVWQMLAAHCSANCVSCGVALRDAKNATNRLSSKSLFPDKSIKKRRRCIYLSRTQGLGCPLIRISNTNAHAGKYIAHTEPIGVGIYNLTGHLVAALLMSLNCQVLSSEESSKNIQSNMYGSTAKAISHYKDIENF